MTNPFYNYPGTVNPFTTARAEAVAAEFTSITAAFALLSTQGLDTGAANSYIITTGGAPTVSYADGQTARFRAANTNTTSSIVNINGLGSVSLLRYGGAALQTGDVVKDTWYTVTYNSAYAAFTITSPTPSATVSGSIATSSPTAKVGLVAAAGSSSAAAPIDAKYAIDQSIAPAWTGAHSFVATGATNTLNFGCSAVTFQWSVGSTGLFLADGTSTYLQLTNGAATFCNGKVTVYADGGVTIGTPTGASKGAGTLNIATGLYVNNVAVTVP